jgi:hypothetical protein
MGFVAGGGERGARAGTAGHGGGACAAAARRLLGWWKKRLGFVSWAFGLLVG